MEQTAPDRIVSIDLEQGPVLRWSPEIEHERSVAIFDLLEVNRFLLRDDFAGPYQLQLSLRDNNLIMDVCHAQDPVLRKELVLAVRPLRRVIKDYFLICDSYFKAIRGATPSRIEAIDMARRGLHDEGAELLKDALDAKVEVDKLTARRLFTLVCVLSLRR